VLKFNSTGAVCELMDKQGLFSLQDGLEVSQEQAALLQRIPGPARKEKQRAPSRGSSVQRTTDKPGVRPWREPPAASLVTVTKWANGTFASKHRPHTAAVLASERSAAGKRRPRTQIGKPLPTVQHLQQADAEVGGSQQDRRAPVKAPLTARTVDTNDTAPPDLSAAALGAPQPREYSVAHFGSHQGQMGILTQRRPITAAVAANSSATASSSSNAAEQLTGPSVGAGCLLHLDPAAVAAEPADLACFDDCSSTGDAPAAVYSEPDQQLRSKGSLPGRALQRGSVDATASAATFYNHRRTLHRSTSSSVCSNDDLSMSASSAHYQQQQQQQQQQQPLLDHIVSSTMMGWKLTTRSAKAELEAALRGVTISEHQPIPLYGLQRVRLSAEEQAAQSAQRAALAARVLARSASAEAATLLRLRSAGTSSMADRIWAATAGCSAARCASASSGNNEYRAAVQSRVHRARRAARVRRGLPATVDRPVQFTAVISSEAALAAIAGYSTAQFSADSSCNSSSSAAAAGSAAALQATGVKAAVAVHDSRLTRQQQQQQQQQEQQQDAEPGLHIPHGEEPYLRYLRSRSGSRPASGIAANKDQQQQQQLQAGGWQGEELSAMFAPASDTMIAA
jgi:hypothetical protein